MGRFACALLYGLALDACSNAAATPTEIVVVVASEYAAGTELARVRVTTADASGATLGTHEFAIAASAGVGAVATPFSFGTHPNGDVAQPLRITIDGLAAGASAPFVTRRATVPWVQGERRRWVLVLERACEGLPCSSNGQTCIGGTCAASSVPIAALTPIAPGQELAVDAGTVGLVDGGPTCRSDPACDAPIDVEVGRGFACALRTSGRVACWGSEASAGQLGNGATDPSSVAVGVVGVTDARSIAAGDAFTCVATETAVSCWGANDLGELARDPEGPSSATPAPIASGTRGTQMFLAASTGCVNAGGPAACWGAALPTFATLPGRCGTSPCARTPIEQSSLGAIAGLSDEGHLCVVRSGHAACVGANMYGEIGDGTHTSRDVLTDALGLASVWSVATTPRSTCAIDAMLVAGTDTVTSAVHCWGADDLGQLGDAGGATDHCVGDVACAGTPGLALAGVQAPLELSATGDTLCARETSGRILCWGSDAQGGLGDGIGSPDRCGEVACAREPTPVRNVTDAIDLDARAGTFCAVRRAGSVVCWGAGHADLPLDVGPLPR